MSHKYKVGTKVWLNSHFAGDSSVFLCEIVSLKSPDHPKDDPKYMVSYYDGDKKKRRFVWERELPVADSVNWLMVRRYDCHVLLTERYVNSLREVMLSEMAMMKEEDHEEACFWSWGVCEIGDLGSGESVCFGYGDEDSKPSYFPKGVSVLVRSCND